MSGDQKPFPASKRKLDKARKDGDSPKSRELTSAAVVLSLFLLVFAGAWPAAKLLAILRHFIGHAPDLSGNNLIVYLREGFLTALGLSAPLLVGAVLLVFVVEGVQLGGLRFTVKPLTFKPERMSPAENAKRLWGVGEGVAAKLFSEILKIGVYALIALCSSGLVLWRLIRMELAGAEFRHLTELALLLERHSRELLIYLSGALAIAGAADFMLARWRWLKRLRMGPEELKREFRESEGQPELRALRRQMHSEIALQQVVQGVRRAKVVISSKEV